MDEELYCVEFTFSGARRHELYVRNVWQHEAEIHARIAREQGWRDVRVLKMSEYWSQTERKRRDEDWYRFCNEQIGGNRAEKVREDAGERSRGKARQGRPYSRTR